MSHGPAMASDLFSEHEIALPLTLAGVGRFGGPVIGPLIGGWIQMRVGWRWLGWTMTVFSGICTLVAAFLVRSPPPLHLFCLSAKRAKLTFDDCVFAGTGDLRSCVAEEASATARVEIGSDAHHVVRRWAGDRRVEGRDQAVSRSTVHVLVSRAESSSFLHAEGWVADWSISCRTMEPIVLLLSLHVSFLYGILSTSPQLDYYRT